jgi:hypothetical protein
LNFIDKYFYFLISWIFIWSILIYIIFFISSNNHVIVNPNLLISKTENIQNISFDEILDYEWNERVWRFERIWWMKNISLLEGKYQVKYPKWSYKPTWEIVWWWGFVYNIPNLENENIIILEYNITIPEGFDFIQWGKLPGLCGGNCPTWWSNTDNGFSARMMWREWGNLEVYWYFSDKNDKYWKSLGRWMDKLIPWNTYKITQEIKLNEPGESDWLMKIFINDEIIYFNDHISYRWDFSIQTNSFMFSTFFWWGTPDWATKKNTEIVFSDIKIKY